MRVWMTWFASAFIFINTYAEAKDSNLIHVEYDNYELWIDCSEKAAVAFRYLVSEDLANLTRYSSFYKDPKTPANCCQLPNKPYSHHNAKLPKYDRGYLAAANHFDSDKKALREANYMSNVTLQAVKLMDHKPILITILVVVIISALGFFADFGYGLIWLTHDKPEDFAAFLMRLLFLTLVTERIVEFYKLMHLTKHRNSLTLKKDSHFRQ